LMRLRLIFLWWAIRWAWYAKPKCISYWQGRLCHSDRAQCSNAIIIKFAMVIAKCMDKWNHLEFQQDEMSLSCSLQLACPRSSTGNSQTYISFGSQR
jgi:hypothetical protein